MATIRNACRTTLDYLTVLAVYAHGAISRAWTRNCRGRTKGDRL